MSACPIEWTDIGNDVESGGVGGLEMFRLSVFDADARRRFADRGYVGWIETTMVLRDRRCLTPLTSVAPGVFTYVTDIDEARATCQRALDAFVAALSTAD
jgi:hypothetical protein